MSKRDGQSCRSYVHSNLAECNKASCPASSSVYKCYQTERTGPNSGRGGGAIGRVKIRGVNLAVEWVGEEIETDWTGGREKRGMDGDGGLVAAYRHRGSGLTNERTAEIKDCLHRDAVRRRFLPARLHPAAHAFRRRIALHLREHPIIHSKSEYVYRARDSFPS